MKNQRLSKQQEKRQSDVKLKSFKVLTIRTLSKF